MTIGADKLCHSNKELKYKTEIHVDLQYTFFYLQSCIFYIYICEYCSFPPKQVMCLQSEAVVFFSYVCKEKLSFFCFAG